MCLCLSHSLLDCISRDLLRSFILWRSERRSMGGDKHGSKRGGYVGGFLQLFDWKSKSRKKLFASKSDLSEQSKVKKKGTTDGNLPTSKHYLTDDDETLMCSSIKGSEYSCASSMTDDDGYVNKVPGVVARLMGLDSMPISYSQVVLGTSILPQKMINSPIKKFQTEILPPKSAKSLPITQNKLLSPIKSPCFVLLKDASDIMEAAAKIIDPGLQDSSSGLKSKPRLLGSSSVPLKVKDLKEKAQGVQKLSKVCKSRSSSDDLNNNKGKSISLAVQAKVNVQKREGLSQNGIRSSSPKKEQIIKKPSTSSSQKENCPADKENLPSKLLPKAQSRRTKLADSSPARLKTLDKSKSKATDHGRLKQDKNDRQISLKPATERRLSLAENNNNKGKSEDVVSFTFASPISRSLNNEKTRRAASHKNVPGCGDSLSVLLEQKLKELTHIVDSKAKDSDLESYDNKNQMATTQSSPPRPHQHKLQINEEKHYPSPISVLESSSYNSSESTTTTTTTSSSVQADANLSDADSSASRPIIPSTSKWELEYLKEIISNFETMFEDYTLGRSQHFVNPQVFHQIETGQKSSGGDVEKQTRKVLFDYINESMDLKCRHYYQKGMKMMRGKDWLADEIYGEMTGCRGSGDFMVDDLVEKDMSNHHGKWAEFDNEAIELGIKIEGRIFASLINEVVADILTL